MTANNRVLTVALLLATFGAASVAQATLMQAATFDDKVEHANAIVVGKVLRKEARWDPEKRWILTYTTFTVQKSLKGVTMPEVTLVTPGGQVGDVYQDTIGVPDFAIGSENVVFIKNTKAGPTVLYFDQGAYDVAKDSRGNKLVMPVSSDAVLIDGQRGMAITPEEPRSLRDFESAIDSSVKRTIHKQQMAMMEKEKLQQPKPSLWRDLSENVWIIAIAILGAILAAIPLVRRSQ
jgi:hypothetical protein